MKLTKKQKKQIAAIIIAVLTVIFYKPDILSTNGIYLSDADSFKLDGKKYRLFGVDAFELKQTCDDLSGIPYPCGEMAKEAMKVIIGTGENLECHEQDIDRYQRSVVTCFVNGKDIAEELVLRGWALDYARYSKGKYRLAEREAERNNTGAWVGTFTEPWDYRKTKKSGH